MRCIDLRRARSPVDPRHKRTARAVTGHGGRLLLPCGNACRDSIVRPVGRRCSRSSDALDVYVAVDTVAAVLPGHEESSRTFGGDREMRPGAGGFADQAPIDRPRRSDPAIARDVLGVDVSLAGAEAVAKINPRDVGAASVIRCDQAYPE